MSRVHNHMEHRDPTRAQHSRDPKSPTHQQGPQHARGRASCPVTFSSIVDSCDVGEQGPHMEPLDRLPAWRQGLGDWLPS